MEHPDPGVSYDTHVGLVKKAREEKRQKFLTWQSLGINLQALKMDKPDIKFLEEHLDGNITPEDLRAGIT